MLDCLFVHSYAVDNHPIHCYIVESNSIEQVFGQAGTSPLSRLAGADFYIYKYFKKM